MTPSEIIHKHAIDVGHNPDKHLKLAAHHLKNAGMTSHQHDDTLMFSKKLGEHEAQVHFISHDPRLAMMASLSALLDILRDKEVKVIYMNTENKSIVQALKDTGVHITPTNHLNFKWVASI